MPLTDASFCFNGNSYIRTDTIIAGNQILIGDSPEGSTLRLWWQWNDEAQRLADELRRAADAIDDELAQREADRG